PRLPRRSNFWLRRLITGRCRRPRAGIWNFSWKGWCRAEQARETGWGMAVAGGVMMYSDTRVEKSDQLPRQHAPLVKRVDHHSMARLPSSVQVDDLIQPGMIGLLEAARKYEPSKGASFETYPGIRIRGAMMDEV